MSDEKKRRGRRKGEGRAKGHVWKSSKRLFRPETTLDEPSATNLAHDMFNMAPRGPGDVGGKERLRHDVEILKIEYAIKGGSLSISSWLASKGYSATQINNILLCSPADEWNAQKASILGKLTESVVKRHIDLIAEVQDLHVKASKLTLVKAMEMLTKGVEFVPKRKKSDGTYELLPPVLMPIRSVDLMNCANSIEKAQQIYRRAMGLPNEEAGLAQVLEKVEQLNIQNNRTEQHVHFHAESKPESPNKEILDKLTYDEVREFIQFRRDQKKAREEDQKNS